MYVDQLDEAAAREQQMIEIALAILHFSYQGIW